MSPHKFSAIAHHDHAYCNPIAAAKIERMLELVSLVGDATCLESVAAAYAHAPGGGDDWWRDHLADTFRAIVKREKLTPRHAVMKKIQKRWPAILTPA